MTRTALLAFSLLLAAGPSWGLRATSHLDALESTLADRAAVLVGATDKIGKKQLKAAEKSLARIAVDTVSLADDLKLAKKLAGPVAKAYATDDEVMDLLTAAADAFESDVEARASVLARAREGLPEAKLTKKADRLLRKAEKARDKALTQSKLKKRLSLLYKAQRSADKAADVLAQALGDPVPTRLLLSPPSALLTQVGETLSFQAIVLDQLDRRLAAPVSWSSTDSSVASVGTGGEVTGGAVGSAQIVATVGDLEAAAVVVSARPAPGAIPVPDEAVVGPLLPIDPESFGMGSQYTAVLRGDAPSVGDLLYGTGERPLGGEVVAVESSGSNWLVTLAIVPLDVLFAELEIRETLPFSDEHAEIPDWIDELFEAERQEDGTWVFTEREGADALSGLNARGVPVGTVADELCSSPTPFPIGFAAGLSLQLQQSFAIDLEYSTTNGLERLVAEGQITATASFKPRVTAAVTGSIECKWKLLQLNIPLPGPLAAVFGAQLPVGAGFKIEGSIQAAQFGFDAVSQFQSTTSAGISCVAGNCEPVTTSTNESTGSLTLVTPDPSTQFTVTAAIRGFGYAELCLGNPIWSLLQLCMLEAQGGLEQTLSWSPTTVQLSNTTAASDYKLLLYFTIGAKAELANVLEFFTVNLASISYRQDHELARSPEGSFEFEGPVALGETARATLQLTNVDYVGVENVQDVRFYRRDSSLSLIQKAVVQRTSAGQTTYEAEWEATSGDLGAEFGAVVVTRIPLLEFEVEKNSLRTLEEGERGDAGNVTSRFQSTYASAGPDQHSFVPIFDDDLSGLAEDSISAVGSGTSASSTQSVDVVGNDMDALESITMAGTFETGPGDTEVTQSVAVSFELDAPTAATFTGLAELTDTVDDDRTVRVILSRDAEFIACVEGQDSDVTACPPGTPTAFSGTLSAGAYTLSVYVYVRGGTDGSFDATLTVMP